MATQNHMSLSRKVNQLSRIMYLMSTFEVLTLLAMNIGIAQINPDTRQPETNVERQKRLTYVQNYNN